MHKAGQDLVSWPGQEASSIHTSRLNINVSSRKQNTENGKWKMIIINKINLDVSPKAKTLTCNAGV